MIHALTSALLPPALLAPAPPAVTVHQARAHPMRYHLSLPEGWTPGHRWPVVVVIPDAHRDFADNLRRFAAVRGRRPFILVSPEVPTCGGTRDQTTPPYSYDASQWAAIRTAGDFAFEDAGLAAVLAEVHDRWGGEPRAFLTGWEAGGHTLWAQALRRPERWRAVAAVDPNYQGRGLTEATFSTSSERRTLPIQVFWCGAPTGDGAQAMPFLRRQTREALDAARAHGFETLSETTVPGADHGPLPEAVLGWFERLAEAPRP